MKKQRVKINTGDFCIIQIVGDSRDFVAEVICQDPLRLKTMELGPFASLKEGSFIIDEPATIQFREDKKKYLTEAKENGITVVSGLQSLGMSDNNQLYLMLVAS